MIASPVVRRRFTVEQYEQMAIAGIFAEDDRIELIEGEIVEISPIGPSHSACVSRLIQLIQQQIGSSLIIRVQDPIRLSNRSEPQPDVALVQPRADFYAGGHPEPEDVVLLVEVADSSLSYDRDLKLPLYARAGIAEVWLVCLLPQTVEVFRAPSESGYGERREARRGESVAALNIPGVMLSVADIRGQTTSEACRAQHLARSNHVPIYLNHPQKAPDRPEGGGIARWSVQRRGQTLAQ